jgi:hypothetical protein
MDGCRCSGETDINPISAAGKVTQLVFAGLPGEELLLSGHLDRHCAP